MRVHLDDALLVQARQPREGLRRNVFNFVGDDVDRVRQLVDKVQRAQRALQQTVGAERGGTVVAVGQHRGAQAKFSAGFAQEHGQLAATEDAHPFAGACR